MRYTVSFSLIDEIGMKEIDLTQWHEPNMYTSLRREKGNQVLIQKL